MSNLPKPPVTYSEPEAQRILNRATELEAGIGTRFTVDDLRAIAATAGIDAQALEHAMNETAVEQPTSHALPAAMDSGMDSGRLALLIGVGAVLGVAAIGADRMPLPGNSAFAVFGQADCSPLTWRFDILCERGSRDS